MYGMYGMYGCTAYPPPSNEGDMGPLAVPQRRGSAARKGFSFMEIIGLIIFGAVIGALARLVLPGRQNISLLVTVIIGIVGALAGYYIWGAIGGTDTSGIDWIRWFISIAVTAILVVLYSSLTGRRRA